MMNRHLVWGVVAGLGVCAGACAQPINRLGAVGDSLTDEYLEEGYGAYADAWTEILLALRGISMGPTASTAGVGFWGEPRRSGYEDNWARFAQTSDEAIGSGQHTGLAAGATSRGVSHAVVFIGTNDWAPWRGVYSAIYDGSWGTAQVDAHIASRVSNMRVILNVLRATSVKLVLATPPDHSVMAWTRGNYPDPVQREVAAQAVGRYAEALRGLGDEYDVPVVDMFVLSRSMWGSNPAPRPTLTIGGVAISMFASGVASDSGFVQDGIHPHSAVQGVWANAMLTALNVGYGTGVTLLSEQEIVTHAGLTYAGTDTLAGQIGSVRQYVLNYRCRADVNADQVVGVQDIFEYLSLWFGSDPRADINGQNGVGVQDIFEFLSLWFSGCV